jgi:glyoxylase-like metal-dependent hydrolase (beta-lactamase superfamily II)
MVERIIVGSMSTNAYLYSEWKKECIIIDPGGDAETLISHMLVKNLKPRGIILTHGHLDHLSAVGEIKAHFQQMGRDVSIAIHRKDRIYLGSKGISTHQQSLQELGLDSEWILKEIPEILPDADILLEEGDSPFNSDLRVIHTPGHTPGSISLYSESQQVLFTGDTLFFEGIGRTDLPGGNLPSIISSIEKKLFTLPEDTRVFPGHGPFTTLEREIQHNPAVHV